MNFHIGKIYKLPQNLYFYKSNQPRLLMEYCKKVKIPNKFLETYSSDQILEQNTSCIEFCKNITIFPENEESFIKDSDDDSWVDMKKFL